MYYVVAIDMRLWVTVILRVRSASHVLFTLAHGHDKSLQIFSSMEPWDLAHLKRIGIFTDGPPTGADACTP